jgi:hypothetical protein
MQLLVLSYTVYDYGRGIEHIESACNRYFVTHNGEYIKYMTY